MSTISTQQSYFRLITNIINRFFFRKKEKQSGNNSYERAIKSIQTRNLSQSGTSYHGDEEAFWFI